MIIAGVGTATPTQRYAQKDCWEALQKAEAFSRLESRSQALLRKVLTADNGIVTRHLALDDLEHAFDISPDTLHARFLKNAPLLGAEAGRRALASAGVEPDQIDAVIVSTCTGYVCPGLTSYITQELELRPDVLNLDLVGQGCVAALPNLRTAQSLLFSDRCSRVLSICVEICSAAFYLDDDPGVLISACLFGDGAGAAVLTSEPGPGRRVEWLTSGSFLNPANRDLLRFEVKHGMLRNVLMPQVPEVAAISVREVFTETSTRAGVSRDEITGWLFHPGGRDVLRAIQEKMNLEAEDLSRSAKVLSNYGNISSPSVFFVLQAALQESAPGGYWWMSAFGAGFSCQGALLKVD
jgi:alkylresorcinol/alkylpyrone synthase